MDSALCGLDVPSSILDEDRFPNSPCAGNQPEPHCEVDQTLHELSDPDDSKSKSDESKDDNELISSQM